MLAAHFRWYQLGVHHHHTGEDELIWPLLLARVDLEADVVVRMEAQHEAWPGRGRGGPEVPPGPRRRWETGRPAGRDALTAHGAVLLEHLDDEEAHVLPLIAEHLTVAEWARLGERFAAETPKGKLLFFLGLILEDASPAERDMMLGNLPAPARALWRAVGAAPVPPEDPPDPGRAAAGGGNGTPG